VAIVASLHETSRHERAPSRSVTQRRNDPYANSLLFNRPTQGSRLREGYAGNADYLAGRDYSIADIVVLPFIGMVIDGLGLPGADYPNLHAW